MKFEAGIITVMVFLVSLVLATIYISGDKPPLELEEKAVCTMEYAPVCGEDGKTYSNRCTLDSKGIKFAYDGECIDETAMKLETSITERWKQIKENLGKVDKFVDGRYVGEMPIETVQNILIKIENETMMLINDLNEFEKNHNGKWTDKITYQQIIEFKDKTTSDIENMLQIIQQQIAEFEELKKIECEQGFTLMLRPSGTAECVKPTSIQSFEERGWTVIKKTESKKGEESEKPDMETAEIIEKAHKIIIPQGASTPGCEESNECYIPYLVNAKIGDTVIWSNDDTAAHTVTSGTPEGGPDGMFDSGLFMSGSKFEIILDEKGNFDYFCMVHPWMTGTIQVD